MSSVPVAGRGQESGGEVSGSALSDLLDPEAADAVVSAVRSALTWRRGGLITVPRGAEDGQVRAHVYPLSDDEALVVFDVRAEGSGDELALSMRERKPSELGKGKRMVVKSIQQRLHNRYNVSVAEVEHNDAWQLAGLEIAAASNSRTHASEVVSNAVAFMEGLRLDVEVIDQDVEVID